MLQIRGGQTAAHWACPRSRLQICFLFFMSIAKCRGIV